MTPLERIYVSGAGMNRPDVASLVAAALSGLGVCRPLPSLPEAWVKHAAQGSALLADAAGRRMLRPGCAGTRAARGDRLKLGHCEGTRSKSSRIDPALGSA